ncbi:30S ribosomal protein S1, chloroplastic [Tetrabaena socialis]|uniref:30S ribosomal protein S1, chloroplastic n=1 Tax=Tetrabaena socialis TaxID=47790 RepID=A0A2J7ZV45_9CHLO|nr:30S ribosomal protein S1, chloroplastic [Tetrabaena socialis]|eukprot:PNH04143.1 30S ribosomal protein S1, chloroplastic [Tetrabaena socialis]
MRPDRCCPLIRVRTQAGAIVAGVVQSIKPYGAFVEIGDVTGMLRVSQVSKERVTQLDAVLKAGDAIKALVLSTDPERGRFTLSTKVLEATPGDMLRDPQLVYDKAEETAAAHLASENAELAARCEGDQDVKTGAPQDVPQT